MSEQTAVERLQEYLAISLGTDRMRLLQNEFQKAKELETEQHLEKWQEGWNEAFDFVEHFRKEGLTIKQYSNEQK
jgi:hypothetical protein